ncbi:RNA exonuclease [Nematocida sp. LUAm3]|nr:RNA exonuclease [Nematocida sp. LUAm3]KAI5173908.1 RNA exonuclease [Nematocida sp. LUAm2]KAI5177347.1 RNA exonuclease [Nematocida sp. LUAm1]
MPVTTIIKHLYMQQERKRKAEETERNQKPKEEPENREEYAKTLNLQRVKEVLQRFLKQGTFPPSIYRMEEKNIKETHHKTKKQKEPWRVSMWILSGEEEPISFPNKKSKIKPIFQCRIKEKVDAYDIPFFLSVDRPKLQEKSFFEVELTQENTKIYRVKDLSLIYKKHMYPGMYTIPPAERNMFYYRYLVDPKQISTLAIEQDILVKYRKPKRKSTPYHTVYVEGKKYIQYYGVTKYQIVGIDCEMVITEKGKELAKIAIVDEKGKEIYKKTIYPEKTVLNYLTEYTGLDKNSFINTCSCQECRPVTQPNPNINSTQCSSHLSTKKSLYIHLASIIGVNTVIVGHSLGNDLRVLSLYHTSLIDTSQWFIYSNYYRYRLQVIANVFLNKKIQEAAHCPVVDAQCSLKALMYMVNASIDHLPPNETFHSNISIELLPAKEETRRASSLEKASFKSTQSREETEDAIFPVKRASSLSFTISPDLHLPGSISRSTLFIMLHRDSESWIASFYLDSGGNK